MNINSDPFRSISLVFLIMVGIMLYQMYDRKQQEVAKLQEMHRAALLAQESIITALQRDVDERDRLIAGLMNENKQLKDQNDALVAEGSGNCAAQVPTASDPERAILQSMTSTDATTFTTGAFGLIILMGMGVMWRTGQTPVQPSGRDRTASQPKAVRPLLLRPINNNNQHGRR
jgi:hypothetical protein